ncbi:hypothetical protein, partial [Bilophila wadsworthia]|uniref:hypothetical protein n=1 Tax=Bilophila wadsworthia TaxID=35833 RepID=UPI00243102F8
NFDGWGGNAKGIRSAHGLQSFSLPQKQKPELLFRLFSYLQGRLPDNQDDQQENRRFLYP